MKKLIKIILLISSVLSFFILFNQVKINNVDNIKNIERSSNNIYKLLMPMQISNEEQNDVYNSIKNTADKYKANIYFYRVETNNDEEEIVENDKAYIYLNDISYFDRLNIYNGRGFNLSENEDELFLSTLDTNKENQIGRIACVDKKYNFSIYSLKELVDSGLLLDGSFFVELEENQKINDFIKELELNIKVNGITLIEKNNYEDYSSGIIWIAIIGLYIMVILLILYDILKKYKDIAIKKMLGYSNIDIYMESISKLVLTQLIIMALVTIVCSVIKLNSYNHYVEVFIKKLFIIYGIQVLILIATISIPHLYIKRIKVSNIIKNEQPTKEILILNTIVKCIILVALSILLKYTILDFSEFGNLYSSSFKKWEETKDYAIVPSIHDGKNIFSIQENADKFFVDCKEIYCYFNQKGAILADFDNFVDSKRELVLEEGKIEYKTDIVTINPNYLEKNTIYDTDGNKVKVDEKNYNTILLIPEKYKINEEDIIKLHKWWNKNDRMDAEVEIIWIKTGQKAFSYNLNVNTKEGNYVTDPVITVMTEENGGRLPYMVIMGYSGNPFKIKLESGESPEEIVLPIINQYGYSVETVRASDTVASEINEVKEKMYLYMINIIFLLIILIILISQNVFSYFNQYKQYLAIRNLHGYSFFDNYKEYLIIVLLSWICIFAAIRGLNIMTLSLQIKISVILILLEIILSILFLFRNNKKNLTNIIKGS